MADTKKAVKEPIVEKKKVEETRWVDGRRVAEREGQGWKATGKKHKSLVEMKRTIEVVTTK